MKYLIYTRISPRGSDFDRTAENSTVMQEEYCRNFIASIGGTITDVYRDEFFSGKDLNRPKMREIIQQLENGNAEWDCLAVYNLARMTRSPRDMYQIFEKLARTGKRFLSIKEPDFDFSKPTSEMIMGIISHVNQFMRKSSAAIVRDKMMAIARRGLWPAGWAPLWSFSNRFSSL